LRFENPSLPPSFDRLRMVSMPNPFPKGGDISFPLWKRGIEGDFIVILLISLVFEIHF
jgi:hypothetical protein